MIIIGSNIYMSIYEKIPCNARTSSTNSRNITIIKLIIISIRNIHIRKILHGSRESISTSYSLRSGRSRISFCTSYSLRSGRSRISFCSSDSLNSLNSLWSLRASGTSSSYRMCINSILSIVICIDLSCSIIIMFYGLPDRIIFCISGKISHRTVIASSIHSISIYNLASTNMECITCQKYRIFFGCIIFYHISITRRTRSSLCFIGNNLIWGFYMKIKTTICFRIGNDIKISQSNIRRKFS
jgi:hypothetical protein